jgi:hypothetical protein
MTVAEAAQCAADDLRSVLAAPHSDEFRRNAVTAARVSVAKAMADAQLDPGVSRSARRRFHATNPGFLARMAAYHELPDTHDELLAVLDAMALTARAA